MNVYGTVAELLGGILLVEAGEIHPRFALLSENKVEPLDIARLAMALEKAFGIWLYDEKIAAWEAVADVVSHVESVLEDGHAKKAIRSDEERTAWFYE